MNKQIFLYKKSVIVTLLWAMACITATAQYGFTPLDGSCINSDGTTSYRFQVNLPGGASLDTYNNLAVTGIGGIQIDYIDNINKIIGVKSKTGVEPDFGYPKYAKGRISISCEAPADSACSAACPYFNPYYSYSYDVYKLFPLNETLNPIVGPVCVVEGDTVTYSVKPWVSIDKAGIGIDNYKWILPPTLTNNILYYSADSSSITFVVDQLTGADTIKAQIGRCNFGDANKITWLALNQAVPEPEIDSVSCLAGGIRTVTFRVKNPVSGVTYTWSCDKHWRIDGNAIGDTVNIITDDYNPANVTVTVLAKNACVSLSNNFISRCQ